LHCHMVVWVEGGLNPSELRERVLGDNSAEFQARLFSFLDDTISTSVPDPPSDWHPPDPSRKCAHLCVTRGIDPTGSDDVDAGCRQMNLHELVAACQRHVHSNTCYKYWKGAGHLKKCRFDLDAANVRAKSSVDPDSGNICLRCLDGLVNNFNETIIKAMRCNMDIKFIGTGQDAKAVLMYITDYIAKTPSKAHVSYAALKVTFKKLSQFDTRLEDMAQWAHRTLQRAAFAMIAQQELSAQQVMSYLLDFEDYFVSHSFNELYWTGFEHYLNQLDPSPEC
ncbi:hypothetical protein CERSUDRAFT_22039, partial [Gelatoporia subvermispora B]